MKLVQLVKQISNYNYLTSYYAIYQYNLSYLIYGTIADQEHWDFVIVVISRPLEQDSLYFRSEKFTFDSNFDKTVA